MIILELREQAQAIRAEGGEQMHADLMMRAATALAAEREARDEAEFNCKAERMLAAIDRSKAETAEAALAAANAESRRQRRQQEKLK